MAMFARLRKEPPRMWGPSFVGYGSYRYAHDGGRTGDAPLAPFAVRGRDLVVYLAPDGTGQDTLRARLGPHRMGKSCLCSKRPADVDAQARALVARSMAGVGRRVDGAGGSA